MGKNWFKQKVAAFTKPKYITSQFPTYGKTVFETTAPLQLNTSDDTLVDGFLYLGVATPTNLEDCFGTYPTVELGVLQDSTINSQGADTMMLIYKQYRVWESSLIIQWRNITPQVSNEAAYTHPGYTETGGPPSVIPTHVIPAHDIVNFAQQSVMLLIIPNTSSTQPVATWREAVNHPFGFKSQQKRHGIDGGWNILKVPAINTIQFLKTFLHSVPSEEGEAIHVKNFTDPSSGTPGIDIFWHLYVLGNSSLHDTTDIEIEGNMFLQQKVLLYKHDQANSSLIGTLASEGAGDFGTLAANEPASNPM